MRFWFFVVSFTLVYFLSGCNSNPYNVSTDGVAIEWNYLNIDSIVFHSKDADLVCRISEWRRKHKEVMEFSFGYCLGIPISPDSVFLRKVKDFKSDPYIKRLEREISKLELNKARNDIDEGIKRMKVHFPNQLIPKHLFFINGLFSASVFCTEKEVVIGLDRYVGGNKQVIQELPSQQFHGWIKKGMDLRFLGRDVFSAWLMTNYIEETDENFASEMIRWGKILFITKQLLPNENESSILRYFPDQWEWAVSSEKSVWRYFVDEELLFKSDEETRVHLLKEGPFSIGLPKESPDRIGHFMGYRMVQDYALEKKIPLKDLIKVPYNEILQAYKAK
jgi:hypothetical protein